MENSTFHLESHIYAVRAIFGPFLAQTSKQLVIFAKYFAKKANIDEKPETK